MSMFLTRRRFGAALAASAVLATSLFMPVNQASASEEKAGAIYVQTNALAGNAIAIFRRNADGTLNAGDIVSTGGLGTGSGLGSQGAVLLSKNGRWLFAVNAGSNEISAFSVKGQTLKLAGKVSSGGVQPISLSSYEDVLYVLNAGAAGNITGFNVGREGELTPLPGSTRPLSNNGVGAAPGPAQVQFSREGEWLVVTEKGSNLLLVYPVDDDGIAGAPRTFPSAGTTPFGFAIDKRDHVLVSEAFGGAPNRSAMSSYDLEEGGLSVISPSVGTLQTAACWVVVTKNGKYAYTTNTGSSNISGYRVGKDGRLTLLSADGITGVTGGGPIDADFSRNDQYLYTLNTRAHSINVFRLGDNGELWPVQELTAVPVTAVGLAAQ